MSKTGRILFQIVLFASFGTLMFVSDLMLDALPNVHLIAVFTVTFTVVYRVRALIPLYIYVFLNGFYSGFALWWVPYLYVWTVLWAVAMLLPRNMPSSKATPVYMAVCGLHGLSFGALYAPSQVLLFFGGDWSKLVPWIISGLSFDVIHCVSNIFVALLIVPLVKILMRLPGAAPLRPKPTIGEKQ